MFRKLVFYEVDVADVHKVQFLAQTQSQFIELVFVTNVNDFPVFNTCILAHDYEDLDPLI